MSNDILNAIQTLANLNTSDLESMDYDTLRKFSVLDLLMCRLKHVSIKKKVMQEHKEEIAAFHKKIQAILEKEANINASIEAFDELPDSDRMPIVRMANLVQYSQARNDFAGAESLKVMVMEMLDKFNLGSLYVLAHAIRRSHE